MVKKYTRLSQVQVTDLVSWMRANETSVRTTKIPEWMPAAQAALPFQITASNCTSCRADLGWVKKRTPKEPTVAVADRAHSAIGTIASILLRLPFIQLREAETKMLSELAARCQPTQATLPL